MTSFFLIIKKNCRSNTIYIRSDFVKKLYDKDRRCLEKYNWKKPSYLLNSEKFIYLDLNKTSEILQDAKPQWRRQNKIGNKNGIIIKFIASPKATDFNLIQDHLSKKNNIRNYNNKREMNAIFKNFKEKYITCSAYDQDNNLVATRGVVICDNIAWHQYSGVIDKGRTLKAGFPLLLFC